MITIPEASKITGYTVRHLRKMLQDGKIEGTKVNRRWMIDENKLQGIKRGNNYGNQRKISNNSAES